MQHAGGNVTSFEKGGRVQVSVSRCDWGHDPVSGSHIPARVQTWF